MLDKWSFKASLFFFVQCFGCVFVFLKNKIGRLGLGLCETWTTYIWITNLTFSWDLFPCYPLKTVSTKPSPSLNLASEGPCCWLKSNPWLVWDMAGTPQPESILQKHRLAKSERLSGASSILGPWLWGNFHMTILTGHVNPSLARLNNWDYVCPQRLTRCTLGQIKWSSLPAFEYIMWLYYSHMQAPVHQHMLSASVNCFLIPCLCDKRAHHWLCGGLHLLPGFLPGPFSGFRNVHFLERIC